MLVYLDDDIGTNMNNIAEKIKYYRNAKGISQGELSQLSGIHLSTIKKYECGTRNPKPDQLLKIADALNVSINDFLSFKIKSDADIFSLVDKLLSETDAEINISDNSDDVLTVTVEFKDQRIRNHLIEYHKRLTRS